MKPALFFLLPVLIIITFFITSARADTPWSPNVQVSATTGNESTIAVFYPNVYVSYNGNPQRFRMSTNGGISWQPESSFPVSCCDGSMYTDELGYIHFSVLSAFPLSVRYFRSTDNGSSWSAPITLNSGGNGVDKNWTFNKNNRIYVGWVAQGPQGYVMRIVKSTDRGLTFSPQVQVNDGPGTFKQWALPREDPKDSNIVYFSMMWDRRNFGPGLVPPWQVFVAKSTDGGSTWLPNVALHDTGKCALVPGMAPYAINTSMAVSPIYNDVYVAWVDELWDPNGKLNIFFSRSTNSGASFEPRVKIPQAPNPDTSYHFQPWIECDRYGTIHLIWYDTRGYAATKSGGRKGTYYTYSTNRGTTWAPEERVSDTTDAFSGFIGHYQSFTTDSLRIYATWTDRRNGTNHVYYSWRPLPTLTGVQQNNNNVAKSFKLNQNYPNPFNPLTTIAYEVPKSSAVTVKVYDQLGREIKTLVNGTQSAGKYEITWDASDNSSGVYFYKLVSGDYSETKKMILIK